MIQYGDNGSFLRRSGQTVENMVYLMLEYVPGGVFYDLIEDSNGGLGEIGAYFFME